MSDANAIPEQLVGMELNRVPIEPGGGGDNGGSGSQGPLQGPYLASSPAAKKKAAKSIDEHIWPDTRKAGDLADESTGATVKAFGAKDGVGWLTSGAFKKAHKTWGDQVKTLENRLKGEESSLLATSTILGGTDSGIGLGVSRIPSSFDGY